mgnify:CR=1 FL=1
MSPAKWASTWCDSCRVGASDGAGGAAPTEWDRSSAIGMQRWQDWHPQPAWKPSCFASRPSATFAIIGQSSSTAAGTEPMPTGAEDSVAAPTI